MKLTDCIRCKRYVYLYKNDGYVECKRDGYTAYVPVINYTKVDCLDSNNGATQAICVGDNLEV